MTEAWDEIVTEALRVMLSIPDIIDYYWPIVQIELSDHQLCSVQYRTTQQALRMATQLNHSMDIVSFCSEITHSQRQPLVLSPALFNKISSNSSAGNGTLNKKP